VCLLLVTLHTAHCISLGCCTDRMHQATTLCRIFIYLTLSTYGCLKTRHGQEREHEIKVKHQNEPNKLIYHRESKIASNKDKLKLWFHRLFVNWKIGVWLLLSPLHGDNSTLLTIQQQNTVLRLWLRILWFLLQSGSVANVLLSLQHYCHYTVQTTVDVLQRSCYQRK